jgi:carotenoid cleavage dioxygenase
VYQLDPLTLADRGKAAWVHDFPSPTGISAHTKLDEHTGELLVFGYSTEAPYMHYGVVSPEGELVHSIDVPLPGPRLPHDMAFSENYAILNDLPMFWDPELIPLGAHVPKYHRDLPTRFAVVPRRTRRHPLLRPTPRTYCTGSTPARTATGWCSTASSTTPPPQSEPKMMSLYRSIDLNRGCGLARTAGASTRSPARHGGVAHRHDGVRYDQPAIAGRTTASVQHDRQARLVPVRFAVKHDVHRHGGALQPGVRQRDAVRTRAGFGPKSAEDDGYLVTITTDVNRNLSSARADATRVADGPIARVRLPERVSSGTHSCWTPAAHLGRSL